jgi:hypothetical protein
MRHRLHVVVRRQIGRGNRAEMAEYEKDLELFQTSLDFVKAARTR